MSAAEQYYYIMDYSGNYYRLSAKDQLVVASGEQEATIFTFADANRRIGGGFKSKFYCMTPVNMDNALEADAVSEEEDESVKGVVADAIISVVRELEVVKDCEVVEEQDDSRYITSDFDISQIDFKEYLEQFIKITDGLTEYRESLTTAESEVDQKICDVLHYIELCETNEEEAGHLVKLLREFRETRRSLKDEVVRLDAFRWSVGTNISSTKAKEALKTMQKLETRKYTPRQLSELFEGCEYRMPANNVPGKKEQTRVLSSAEQKFDRAYEEEAAMEYVKRDTVFDGKQNDWMAFARMQADFYRDVNQYIINLQISVDEIDAAIADLMEEIEDTNCNVTQGYRMLKRLKDLRLERKNKCRELDSLYILTEQFDLGFMADVCENNVATLEQYVNDTSVKSAEVIVEEVVIGEERDDDSISA